MIFQFFLWLLNKVLVWRWILSWLVYELIMAEGKPIPTELRNEEFVLRQEIDLEDDNTAGNALLLFYF